MSYPSKQDIYLETKTGFRLILIPQNKISNGGEVDFSSLEEAVFPQG
jgi:hypothetical protein